MKYGWMDGWMDECYVVGAYLLSLSTTPIIIMGLPLEKSAKP
jgi:hypothetical protein